MRRSSSASQVIYVPTSALGFMMGVGLVSWVFWLAVTMEGGSPGGPED